MRYFGFVICVCLSFTLSGTLANEPSFTQEFEHFITEQLSQNAKIKQLEYEIQALESKAKAEAKWDNPSLSFGMSNAEVPTPLNLSANDMQNIFVSIGQNLDINAKKSLQAKITRKEARIKLLELKSLKNQYVLSIITESVNANKNQQILSLTQDAINNLNILIKSIRNSTNFNPTQLHKLNILKTKLHIKHNDVQNQLQNAHIAVSEVSFEHSQKLDIPPPATEALESTKSEVFLQAILESNYDIQIAHLRDDVAKDSLRLARKSYLGDINLSGSYMYRVNRPDMFALSLAFPLPLYGKERQLVKQSHYENLIAQSSVADAQNAIKHKVFNLRANLTNLQENLALIDSALLPSNQKISSLYRHHSTSQSGAFTEFYSALNDEIDAQILRLEILAQIHIAYFTLKSLQGDKI